MASLDTRRFVCLLLLLAGAVHAVSAQCAAPTPNPCFSSGGTKSICCAGSCGPFAPNGDATCAGPRTPTLSVLELVNITNGALGPQANTGSRVGDLTYFVAPITDLSGSPLGRADGFCFYALANPNFEQQCTFSFYFDSGDSLNFQGRFLSTPSDVGVNSGTGKYVGAKGYATSTFVSSVANILSSRYDIFLV